MNALAAVDLKWPGLAHPNGDRIRLNNENFVAIDRDRDSTYDPIYRPQALYNRATNGFMRTMQRSCYRRLRQICQFTAPILAQLISIFTFHQAVSSSC
jgi:hypothetical protein